MVSFWALLDGEAEGPLLRLTEPLSFWGGYDPGKGRISDVRHPQYGLIAAGRVVVMPSVRGSSSSSSVIAEAVRQGTAPAAIILGRPDGILLVGAVVADALYGVTVPLLVGDVARLDGVPEGTPLRVKRGGWVEQI